MTTTVLFGGRHINYKLCLLPTSNEFRTKHHGYLTACLLPHINIYVLKLSITVASKSVQIIETARKKEDMTTDLSNMVHVHNNAILDKK